MALKKNPASEYHSHIPEPGLRDAGMKAIRKGFTSEENTQSLVAGAVAEPG